MSIKVVLADDHQVVREGLRVLIEKEEGFVLAGEAENGLQAVEQCRHLQPDVLVIDVTMPELNGIEATRQIVRLLPSTKVIALSVHSDRRFVSEMLKAGAKGYLPKHCAFHELATAIHEVSKGHTYISPKIAGVLVEDYVRNLPVDSTSAYETLAPRERAVLQLISEGRSTKEIANTMHLSIKTIDWYRHEIMTKLNIDNVAGLVKFALREGITSSD
jgi:two-component system response regulator NreC